MNSNPSSFKYLIFISLILILFIKNIESVTPKPFCHTKCHAYQGTCFDIHENSCYVCAISVYKDKDFTNPLNPCQLKDQRKIYYQQLNSSSMSLTGYNYSSPMTRTCGNITFSGQYISSDYLSKNYTGINTEHYELIIRFGIGYMGSWSESDNLQLQINDGVSTSYYRWSYRCGILNWGNGTTDDTQNLCGLAGKDCVGIKQYIIQHNSSFVNLKWTSLTSQTNPNVQSWGIKDVMIVAKTCHRYCDKCYGGNVNECLTCSAGYFLRGNTCIDKCPKYSLPLTRECVQSCPSGYYPNGLNNFCDKCLDGCTLCSGPGHCLLWKFDHTSQNLFTSKIQLWVIMIIGGFAVIGFVLWKFFLKKIVKQYFSESTTSEDSEKSKPKSVRTQQNSGQFNELKNTQENITNNLWNESMDNIEPIKVDVRKRKKRKADTNIFTPSNSEVNL